MSTRYHAVGLRLTDAEYDLLQRQAVKRHWTKASLARFIVVAHLAQLDQGDREADHPIELDTIVSREPAQPDSNRE